jgi:prophage regulatory protein
MDQNPVSPPAAGKASPPPRFLRLKEVCRLTGLGRSYIYQLQANKQFPQSVKIGVRAVGWVEEEVRKWAAERIANSRREKSGTG